MIKLIYLSSFVVKIDILSSKTDIHDGLSYLRISRYPITLTLHFAFEGLK